MTTHLHRDLVAERAREVGGLLFVDDEPRVVPGRHAAVQERAVQEHRLDVVAGDAERGRMPRMQVRDAHGFRPVPMDAGVDAPFERHKAAGMVHNGAVEIEDEDVLRLDGRLVGAAARAEQHPIGAGHPHRNVTEHPDRALHVEHPRQDRGLVAQRRFVVHVSGLSVMSLFGGQQAALQESDDLRRRHGVRRRVRGRRVAVHEAVLRVRVIVPHRWRGAFGQRLLEDGVGRRLGDVVVAGLQHQQRAGDGRDVRERVLLLVGKPRDIDRRIGGGAGRDPMVARGDHQGVAAADAEADDADRFELQLLEHVVDPGARVGVHLAVAYAAHAPLRFLVVVGQRHPLVVVADRGGEARTCERLGVAAHEGVDAENGRQHQDACLGGCIGLRQKAEQA